MAKISQVFDMRFTDGVNVLHPPGKRGPPPCFPQRSTIKVVENTPKIVPKKSTPYYNNPEEPKKVADRFVNAGINEHDMGVRLSTPKQIPRAYDMTNGTKQDDIEDGLGSNYTRLAACNELSCGTKNWNGKFNVYPEDDEEPRGGSQGMGWQYKNQKFVRPSQSTTNPKLFYPRYNQPNVYELASDLQNNMVMMMDNEEMISFGPIAIKKNWLTWILIFIMAFFVFDKLLLSLMMIMKKPFSD